MGSLFKDFKSFCKVEKSKKKISRNLFFAEKNEKKKIYVEKEIMDKIRLETLKTEKNIKNLNKKIKKIKKILKKKKKI